MEQLLFLVSSFKKKKKGNNLVYVYILMNKADLRKQVSRMSWNPIKKAI